MIRSDEPIQLPDDDLLGRAKLAAVIADEIRTIDASEGFVVGVLGPWGSGKTSLINLIRAELNREPTIAVLEFNPWMFSGADQLVERFFVELSEQLERGPRKLQEAAALFARYSRVMAPLKYVPVAGSLFEGVQDLGEAIKSISDERKGGVAEHKQRLREGLEKLDTPIVVVIDDIDRLSASEIRDVFKLVRLTANFPRIIYVVAFDRLRVEHALSDDGISGRDYLAKIIQAAFDIPAIPPVILNQQITDAMDRSISDIQVRGSFDEERWPSVFLEVMRPLFRNMRDVRRFVASLPGTIRSLDGKISLVDTLGLEAIRVFLPDTFAKLIEHQEALTAGHRPFFTEKVEEPRRKAAIEQIVHSAGVNDQVVKAMVRLLFPAATRHLEDGFKMPIKTEEWARDTRVAHPDMLAFYLERVAGNRLKGYWEAEKALEALNQSGDLEGYLRSHDPANWEYIISALESYEAEVSPLQRSSFIATLINLLPEIPFRHRNFFELSGPSGKYAVG